MMRYLRIQWQDRSVLNLAGGVGGPEGGKSAECERSTWPSDDSDRAGDKRSQGFPVPSCTPPGALEIKNAFLRIQVEKQ